MTVVAGVTASAADQRSSSAPALRSAASEASRRRRSADGEPGSAIHTPREPSRLSAALVRFTPGARTNWHSHALGQTLHCTDGEGLVVSRDGTVIRMRAGDTVWTPPGEEHWHGATEGNLMCHYALLEGTADGDGTTWLELVTDEQYREVGARVEQTDA